MKLLSYSSLIFILLLSSCAQKFERQKELINYLTNVHQVELNNSKNIIILQSGFCGACTDAVVNFVLDNFNDLDKETIIILTSDRKDLVKKLQTLGGNVKLLVDNNSRIAKYGLRYSSDMFFRMDGSSISYWTFIKEEKLKSIRKHIK